MAPPPQPVASNRVGAITSIEPIRTRPQGSGAGAVIGGVLGAVVGNQFGHGLGRAAITGAGAVGGALAGNNVERNYKEGVSGYRIVVRLDNGRTRTFDRTQVGEPARRRPRPARREFASIAPDVIASADGETSARIHVGVGGWVYEPWRDTFYPPGLPKTQELEYLSRRVTAIEINATYYRTQSPASFAKWRDATPDGFVFSVKANRFATNRRVLAEAGESIERFVASGLAELGPKLGPLVWQFATTKSFDAADFGAFLALLPRRLDALPLRHAMEVRHPSFMRRLRRARAPARRRDGVRGFRRLSVVRRSDAPTSSMRG